MKLKLTHNMTKSEVLIDHIEESASSPVYYDLDIELPENMDDGEYTYCLFDDDWVLKAEGLMQIGEYRPKNHRYENKEKNTYITYGE